MLSEGNNARKIHIFLEKENSFQPMRIQIPTSFSTQRLNINKRKMSAHISDEQFASRDLILNLESISGVGRFHYGLDVIRWKKQSVMDQVLKIKGSVLNSTNCYKVLLPL